jgi:predicted Rossmann fold flavoprotein
MRIAIIGGGASGLYSAIALKKKHPEAEVSVFEKEAKLGRKLYATGNGHCNLLNASLKPEDYNHPVEVEGFLHRYGYLALLKALKEWGIETRQEGDYVYPLSYSAAAYVGFLSRLAESLGVRLILGSRVTDYERKEGSFVLKIDAKPTLIDYKADRLIFAFGGASTPKLGSDGQGFSLLKKHGYSIVPLEPGLAPLKVEHPEKLKGLAGFRHEAKVTLQDVKGQALYQENGEVLFKEDGLSGIVIFDVESAYLRLGKPEGACVSLDLFPNQTEADLSAQLGQDEKRNPSFYFAAYFPSEVQPHFLQKDGLPLAHHLKNDLYKIKGTYGFENSQVTVGGVALSMVDEHLESRKEEGVYFVGEALDIDGFCGGFNLSWALLSALIVRDAL